MEEDKYDTFFVEPNVFKKGTINVVSKYGCVVHGMANPVVFIHPKREINGSCVGYVTVPIFL